MSLHEHDLSQRLKRFLDRKQMPRRFEGKPVAVEDEIKALASATARSAPRGADALARWWEPFEAHLSEACGHSWPTEKEVAIAAKSASRQAPRVTGSSDRDMSPEAVAGRRMARSEDVGEGWLYGSDAVRLIATGNIDECTMSRYRSAAFLRRKRTYGEAEALKWETEAKARHDYARVVHRDRNTPPEPRDTSLPDKRETPPDGWAA